MWNSEITTEYSQKIPRVFLSGSFLKEASYRLFDRNDIKLCASRYILPVIKKERGRNRDPGKGSEAERDDGGKEKA